MECWVTPDKSITPVLQHSKFPVPIGLRPIDWRENLRI